MQKLLELEKKLREAKKMLEKAKTPNIPKGYKPIKPTNEPKHIGSKNGVAVYHTGKDAHGHNFEVHKEGKRIADISLDHKTKDIGTFGGGDGENYDDTDAAQELVEAHIKKNPEKFAKSVDERLDAVLVKIGVNTGAGSVVATGGPSIASQIGFGKAEDDKEEKKKKDKKHPDEKEDKEMIANALDRHNEKKHGEDKDEDSAQKDMGLKKANKFGAKKEMERTDAMNSARQVAIEIDPKTGSKKVVSPEAQVKAKVDSAAEKKGKAEAEAAARRMSYRQDGVLKMEMCKFDKNGQWSLSDKEDDKDEDKKEKKDDK